MAVTDAAGFILSLWIDSASPHEVKLVEKTLDAFFIEAKPEKLVGDKAYDSDPLHEKLKLKGIALIAPHRANRKKPPLQTPESLLPYKRRWKVERAFAHVFNYRRTTVRYERKAQNFLAFLHLAASMILLKSTQPFMR